MAEIFHKGLFRTATPICSNQYLLQMVSSSLWMVTIDSDE